MDSGQRIEGTKKIILEQGLGKKEIDIHRVTKAWSKKIGIEIGFWKVEHFSNLKKLNYFTL